MSSPRVLAPSSAALAPSSRPSRRAPLPQADTDPAGHGTGHPFLAVNSDTDAFSLCPFQGNQVSVVYNATAGQEGCYPVKLQLIY